MRISETLFRDPKRQMKKKKSKTVNKRRGKAPAAIGVRPAKSLGQNFLIDEDVIDAIVAGSGITKDTLVIEIGPGTGALTLPLAEKAGHVIAVELDERVIPGLRVKTFSLGNVDILHDDILKVDLRSLTAEALSEYGLSEVRIVGNLPYYITTEISEKVLLSQPEVFGCMVQKEAAERWFSESGCKSFGAIGIYLQAMYRLEQKCNVSKRCFYPQPKVDSVLLHIQKRTDGYLFPKEFKQFIRELFTHRRQQIARACNGSNAPFADDFLHFLGKQNLPKTGRAEAVPLELWIAFSKAYFSKHSGKMEFLP